MEVSQEFFHPVAPHPEVRASDPAPGLGAGLLQGHRGLGALDLEALDFAHDKGQQGLVPEGQELAVQGILASHADGEQVGVLVPEDVIILVSRNLGADDQLVRLPLGGEFHHQAGFIQPEGFEVLFRPQIPLLPEPGQGGQHGVHHGLVGLGVQGGGEVPDLVFFDQAHLVFTPDQGQVAEVAFLKMEDFFGLFVPGHLLFLAPPQAAVGPGQDQENHHVRDQPPGSHRRARRRR